MTGERRSSWRAHQAIYLSWRLSWPPAPTSSTKGTTKSIVLSTLLLKMGITRSCLCCWRKGRTRTQPTVKTKPRCARQPSRATLLAVVETLLGADANIGDGRPGGAALYLAAEGGHNEIVSLLLEKEADKDARNYQDAPPLCKVASGGHLPVVETLLSAGADFNSRDIGNGSSPLHVAAGGGHGEIVSLLLEKGAEKDAIDMGEHTPLFWAVRADHLAVVKTLIAADVDICSADDEGFTALHLAVMRGHGEIASTLVQAGGDKDALDNRNGITPLILAVEVGLLPMVEILVAAGANLNIRHTTNSTAALHVAVRHGQLEIVFVLLRNGAEADVCDEGGDTPLTWAVYDGILTVVDALLAAGADLALRSDGCVALHGAARKGHDEVVSSLLKNGADKDVLDDRDETPLCMATVQGHLAVVETLLAADADVHARIDNIGLGTVLHAAARQGNYKIVSVLLKKRADKDARDEHGEPPLFAAVRRTHLTIVEHLVAAGADLNIRSGNRSNDSMLSTAFARGGAWV